MDWDGGGGVMGLEDVSDLPRITAWLVRKRYTEQQIAGIWGGNLLRVMGQAQAYAAGNREWGIGEAVVPGFGGGDSGFAIRNAHGWQCAGVLPDAASDPALWGCPRVACAGFSNDPPAVHPPPITRACPGSADAARAWSELESDSNTSRAVVR